MMAKEKVIVLGFDGVDARYTEQWMNEGKLPNLARLRAQGTFRPLRPTVPAQTPVSWSTFSTVPRIVACRCIASHGKVAEA